MGIGSLFAVTARRVHLGLAGAGFRRDDAGRQDAHDRAGLHLRHAAAVGLCPEARGQQRASLAYRIDRVAVVLLPLLFYGWAAWLIAHNVR
jgi:hypothetical protein